MKVSHLKKLKRRSIIKFVEKNEDTSSDDEFKASSASPAPESLPPKMRHQLQNKNDVFADAKRRLHTSEVPKKLLKRENEYKEIYDFVLEGVKNKISQALYISGVPGTGKTASVLKVTFYNYIFHIIC